MKIAFIWIFYMVIMGRIRGEVEMNRVVFVINSQPNEHHSAVATKSKEAIMEDLKNIGVKYPRVHLAHRDQEVPLHGAWTYIPTLVHLAKETSKNKVVAADWFVFLEENTKVNPEVLKELLAEKDPAKEWFLGHALSDSQHVIIHHYEKPGIEYPHLSAGFVISAPLAKSLSEKMEELKTELPHFPKDFSIDPSFDLTRVIYHMHSVNSEGTENPEEVENPLAIVHDERFCTTKKDTKTCAFWPEGIECDRSGTSKEDLTSEKVLFGVKTCEKFHKERLPVIRDTWAKAALNIMYFSEVEDKDFETVRLPGVINTERGHCGKSEAILKYFHANANKKGWEWLVIADDDTILSVKKMLDQLACYNPNKLISLGQRYGFRVSTGQYGYDYITGGGSMVFSKKAVGKLVATCKCPSADTPDDMHLGACMASMGIPLVHSPRFHQARPEDYHPKELESHDPLSFHKFWNTDPIKIYQKWFEKDDQKLKDVKAKKAQRHEEL